MLEAYSAAYYLGRVAVEPGDGEHAVLERGQHRQAAATVYAFGEGIERLDLPLVVKFEGQHLPVFGSDTVPVGMLAVPDDVLEASRVENPPSLTEILVAKAERAVQLLEWFTPYTLPEPAVG